MLQIVEAAEELPVRVLDPALAHRLVGEIVGVLQIGEPDHQPRRLAGTASRVVIERPERGLKALPLDQLRQAHQRMLEIELAAQPGAEKIVRTLALWSSGTHRKSPENAAVSGNSAILRCFPTSKNPFSRNNLCLFQGRLGWLRRRAKDRPQGQSWKP